MPRWFKTGKGRKLLSWSPRVVVLLVIFFTFLLTPWFREFKGIPRAQTAFDLLALALVMIAVPATAALLHGMAIACARVDRSRLGVKLFWFVLFFLTPPIGSVLYYFFVYRRHAEAWNG